MTLPHGSPQEIFDSACKHIMTQRRMAGTIENNMPTCKYRMPDGTKCIVGAFIPDNLYDPGMEHAGSIGAVLFGISEGVFSDKLSWMELYQDILFDLQSLHDSISTWEKESAMRDGLDGIAERYGLNPRLIDLTVKTVFGSEACAT